MADPIVDFLEQHTCARRTYLGDGLYMGTDHAGMVWLVTDRYEQGLHYVALDEHVQHSLVDILTKRKTPNPKPQEPDDDA